MIDTLPPTFLSLFESAYVSYLPLSYSWLVDSILSRLEKTALDETT